MVPKQCQIATPFSPCLVLPHISVPLFYNFSITKPHLVYTFLISLAEKKARFYVKTHATHKISGTMLKLRQGCVEQCVVTQAFFIFGKKLKADPKETQAIFPPKLKQVC